MKEVLIYASYKNQKYYFNNKFDKLPQIIKKELKVLSICISEKINGAFSFGFYNNGDVYLEAIDEETFDFDEIEAKLQLKNLEKEQAELLNSLTLFYLSMFGREQCNV